MKKWPRISIVTPSFNQGQFIERTIKSVLSQNYPNLQYIVMDGGSTDQTLTILKKYSKQLDWVSQKDNGQTDAINKGMAKSDGEILAYLNSDDVYEPGTLKKVATFFLDHPRADFVYSHGRLIDQDDAEIGFYNDSQMDYQALFGGCGISQSTTFWRRRVYEKIGPFNDSFNYTMDYEYWVRVSQHFKLHYLPQEIFASSRIHADAKTSSQTLKLYRDAIRMQQTHYKKVHHDWIFTYVDGLVHAKKNGTLWQEVWYWKVLFGLSTWYQMFWNKSLPSKPMRRQYRLWLKEMSGRIKRRLLAGHS